MANNRLVFLDISKFFAISGVICTHAYTLGYESQNSLNYLSYGRFGVQLFFLVSGATVFLSFSKIIKNFSNPLKIFYCRRFFRIIPLFIFMAIVEYFFPSQNSSKLLLETNNKNFFYFISPLAGLFPDSQNFIPGGYSIWNVIYFYLFFPLYYKFRNSIKFIIGLAILFASISILINFRIIPFGEFIQKDWNNYDFLNFFSQFIVFVFGVEFFGKRYINIILFSIIYFFIGLYFKFSFFNDYLFVADKGGNYFLPFISISMFFLLRLISKINFSHLKKSVYFPFSFLLSIGRMTYTLYFVHFYIIFLFKSIFAYYDKPFWFTPELAILITIFLSITLTKSLKPITEEFWVNLGNNFSKKYLEN
mgnify:CR=1 FL=1